MGTGELSSGRRGTASVSATGSVALVAVVALVALALAGCGADVERTEAGRAADAFTGAGGGDTRVACDRLAPRTLEVLEQEGAPCREALADAGLTDAGERLEVTVAGHSAQVRYARDTVFLALFDDGWRVTAAGCRRDSPDPAVPYDCTVDGR